MKAIYFFILFIFLLENTFASEIGLSPTQLDFSGETNQKICREFSVSCDSYCKVILEDRWAEKEILNKKLSLHNLNSESLGLEIFYPIEVALNKEGKISVCVLGKESGNYHGVILARKENSNSGVGVWLNVSLEQGTFVSKLTGAVVGEDKNYSGFVLVFSFCLLIFLLLLILLLGRKRTESLSVL